jgi:hypothetical protein
MQTFLMSSPPLRRSRHPRVGIETDRVPILITIGDVSPAYLGAQLRRMDFRRSRARLLDGGLALAARARLRDRRRAHLRAGVRLSAGCVARRAFRRVCEIRRRRDGALASRSRDWSVPTPDPRGAGERRASFLPRRQAASVRLDRVQRPVPHFLDGRGERPDRAAHGREPELRIALLLRSVRPRAEPSVVARRKRDSLRFEPGESTEREVSSA